MSYVYHAQSKIMTSEPHDDIKWSDFQPCELHDSEFIKFFYNQLTKKFLIEISLSPSANFNVLMDFPGFVQFINNDLPGIASLKPNLTPQKIMSES